MAGRIESLAIEPLATTITTSRCPRHRIERAFCWTRHVGALAELERVVRVVGSPRVHGHLALDRGADGIDETSPTRRSDDHTTSAHVRRWGDHVAERGVLRPVVSEPDEISEEASTSPS